MQRRIVFLLLGLLALATGCSPSTDTGSTSGDKTKPRANYLYPATDEYDVPVNAKLVIKFDEALDPSTIISGEYGSIVLRLVVKDQNGQPTGDFIIVPGTTEYIDSGGEYVIIFTPDGDLAENSSYDVFISNAIADLSGNRSYLYEYTFETGSQSSEDLTPPTVVSTVPANLTTNVAVNRSIIVNFSEEMTASSIDSLSFYVQKTADVASGVKVGGTISYASGSATLKPSQALAENTDYTATVTATVKDLAGNSMVADYIWTFTTGGNNNTDTIPPTVTLVSPADGAINVSELAHLTATFSEPLNGSTVNKTSFTLENDLGPIDGTVSYNGSLASFIPTSSLAAGKLYIATLTTDITDLAGNKLDKLTTWSFTVVNVVNTDTVPPVVTAVTPLVGAIGVPTNTSMVARFSEALDPTSINTNTFKLEDTVNGTGVTIAASVNYDGVSASLVPLSPLQADTLYTATLTNGVKDLAGNSMTANYAWSFRTQAAPDITPPTVVQYFPQAGAADVISNTNLTALFSEALNPASVNTTSFLLTRTQDLSQLPAVNISEPVVGTVSYNAMTATFNPNLDLLANSQYTARLTTAITDVAGNPITAEVSWTFTTPITAVFDTVPPTLITQYPAPNATGLPVLIGTINASFSEALDANTVLSNNNVKLEAVTNNQGTPITPLQIAGTVNYDNNGYLISITPNGNLAFGTTYQVTISTGVTDLAGNPLAAAIIWQFTTITAQQAGGGMMGGGGGGGGGGG